MRAGYRQPWIVILLVLAGFGGLLFGLYAWLGGMDWLEFLFPAVFLVPLAVHLHSGADHLASWEAGEQFEDDPEDGGGTENPYEKAEREIRESLGSPMTDRMFEARAKVVAFLLFAGLIVGFVVFAVRVT